MGIDTTAIRFIDVIQVLKVDYHSMAAQGFG